jgi:transcriptional regulator with PAS, ATPase and Fis domain
MRLGRCRWNFRPSCCGSIETKTVSPLGGTVAVVDVRIIAASNRDLKTAVRDGAFRSDLFYRLNTMPVYLPPLWERRTDLSLLVDYFLEGFIIEFRRPVGLQTNVYSLLEKYAWPGNVRKLKSPLKRVFLLTEKSELNATDFAPHLDDETEEIGEDNVLPLKEALAHYERQYLRHALEQTGGDKAEAARLLNIPLRTFCRKLTKYNL